MNRAVSKKTMKGACLFKLNLNSTGHSKRKPLTDQCFILGSVRLAAVDKLIDVAALRCDQDTILSIHVIQNKINAVWQHSTAFAGYCSDCSIAEIPCYIVLIPVQTFTDFFSKPNMNKMNQSVYHQNWEATKSHIYERKKKKTVQIENSICTTLNAQFQQATDHFISFFY